LEEETLHYKDILNKNWLTGIFLLLATTALFTTHISPTKLLPPTNNTVLHSLENGKKGYEVFGFAPYWTLDKLDNVDFTILSTFAYFGIPVQADGNLNVSDTGYDQFKSDQATAIFQKAHKYGTRVVVTITQMDNTEIMSLMDNLDAQKTAISQTVDLVKKRGIDGVNVDFEYVGDPGDDYRNKFSNFVKGLTEKMHQEVPHSKVTVSVYASSVKDRKIYNIAEIAKDTDGIFMMAYDFATAGSDAAMPTAPLHGYKEGQYWYDVASAVDDFLKVMPSNKLILGLPWYAYNYVVYSPTIKAETRPYYSWKGQPMTQTYSTASAITANTPGIENYQTGWDTYGQVGWKAYYVSQTGTWRMVFMDDQESLKIKYDFAKNKNLAGVGMWALGFDEGKKDLWNQLEKSFGTKYADSFLVAKHIDAVN
jgi:spore germination protein YaaH